MNLRRLILFLRSNLPNGKSFQKTIIPFPILDQFLEKLFHAGIGKDPGLFERQERVRLGRWVPLQNWIGQGRSFEYQYFGDCLPVYPFTLPFVPL
jgi:hypothetical protein